MNPEEIEAMIRADTTWQRPTWPLGRLVGSPWRIDPERVRDPLHVFEDAVWADQAASAEAAGSPEANARRVMNLSGPLTIDEVKTRYKELCKKHHPDANNGDKAAEERFKEIGQAYRTLMDSLTL